MIEVNKLKSWNPPDGWIEFQTIDAHTEGNHSVLFYPDTRS